jgi:hypothetical protein
MNFKKFNYSHLAYSVSRSPAKLDAACSWRVKQDF